MASHQQPTVKMMSVDGHVDIFSVDMEKESERPEEKRETKEEKEDRKCIICLEERKLTVREWRKRDGTLARQFHRARANKLFCCSGWCHNSFLLKWVEQNGRLLLLFKCPHCRSLGCDFEEMAAFRDGEL